ncbi:MAG: response regulator [Nitrospirae bacterium]|nr:response regulator [Nitrospirota bacterium]
MNTDGSHILAVDDEADILEVIRYNLMKAGHRVTCAETGQAALNAALADPPGLIVLDRMLPDLDGVTVCQRLKADPRTRDIPVLMLTAKGTDPDVVGGLTAGADDYVVKPFSPPVLAARVAALLRRAQPEAPEGTPISVHGVEIDPGRHRVAIDGAELRLTPSEFRILQLLAGRPGWVFSRMHIMDRVKGEGTVVTERSIDVQVAGLRKKMGDAGPLIETVRGMGYRFKG